MNQPSLRLFFTGPSGIGKSILAELFHHSWEPLRVRHPRNKEEEHQCISEYDLLEFEKRQANKPPIFKGSEPNNLIVFTDYSTFTVRGKRQVMMHEETSNSISMHFEFFAPVLVEMLESGFFSKVNIDISNPLFVILNPLSVSFRDMADSSLLHISTAFSITERSRINNENIDIGDVLRRLEYLRYELSAWRNILHRYPGFTIECKEWKFFEFGAPKDTESRLHFQQEAINSIFKSIDEQLPLKATDLRTQIKGMLTERCKSIATSI